MRKSGAIFFFDSQATTLKNLKKVLTAKNSILSFVGLFIFSLTTFGGIYHENFCADGSVVECLGGAR